MRIFSTVEKLYECPFVYIYTSNEFSEITHKYSYSIGNSSKNPYSILTINNERALIRIINVRCFTQKTKNRKVSGIVLEFVYNERLYI